MRSEHGRTGAASNIPDQVIMAQADRYRIPSTLDDPEKMAFWTIDEFCVLIGGFAIGIVFSRFVEGIIAGFIGVQLLKRFKRGESLNILRYALYWIAPSGLFSFKRTLASYKRELAG
ncbi:MAG: type IV conjugative transfer system protein TraL [Pseudomonadota bacterium]